MQIEQLEKFEIPDTKLYLIRTRDVFLFQCYTGIRYSDLANLRKCDVHDKYIEITTIKTGHSDYKAMKPYIDVADEIKAEAMKKFNDF